jgi:RHS repeat-associated protein
VNNGWQLSIDVLNESCFYYLYDHRNRLTTKKVPGSEPVFMIYDNWNRLVLTQDGKQRTNNQWAFNKFDKYNRIIYTGLFETTQTIGDLIILLDSYYAGNKRYENRLLTSDIGYTTDQSFPSASSNNSILNVSYYDDYEWTASHPAIFQTKDNSYDSDFANDENIAPFPQPLTQNVRIRGQVTGLISNLISTTAGTFDKIRSVMFYDERGKVVQTKSENITGGIDINTTQYNFKGLPLKNILFQDKAGVNSTLSMNIYTTMEYDNGGRLKKIKKKVRPIAGSGNPIPNGTVETILLENEYDDLGELKVKRLAPTSTGGELESINYDYNIRGWLTSINKNYLINNSSEHFFGMELGYEKGVSVTGETFNRLFNGNIGGTIWRSKGDNVLRKYDYSYDKVNRLMAAQFTQEENNSWNNSSVDFSVKMGDGIDYTTAYDENGNILRMQQWGLQINSSSQIDDLLYTYKNNNQSNRLQNVIDQFNTPATLLGDFKTNTTHPQYPKTNLPPQDVEDYLYDDNGNMIKDLNKSISDITYNFLNLPSKILVDGKGFIEYVYDASGNKLRKIVTDNSTQGVVSTTTTTYIGPSVYESRVTIPADPNLPDYTDLLQFISHEEGRIRFVPLVINPNVVVPAGMENMFYDYFLKDHLGNIRMVLTSQNRVDKYPAATLEPQTLSNEENFYSIQQSQISLSSTITGLSAYINDDNGIGNVPTNSQFEQANSTKMYRLNSTESKMGLGMTLKVMAGDKIDIFGGSYYFQNNSGGNSSNDPLPITSILSGLLGSPGASTIVNTKGIVTVPLINTNLGTQEITTILNNQNNNGMQTAPKAFINYLFFDEQFKCVGGGFSRIGQVGVKKQHFDDLQNLTVPKNGFVYIYCSNESPVNVFFDNLQVVHTRGRILEETHYYPFGLVMAGISSKAAGSLINKKKFNGIEHNTDFDLTTYEAFYRTNDPQIGRWWQIDPKCEPKEDNDEIGLECLSPYNSMSNNPISLTDPLGDEAKNEYKIVMKGGEVVSTAMTGTKGGNQKDFITVVNMDRAPYADGVKTVEVDVAKFPTSGPGNNFDEAQKQNPTPGYREFHNKSTELAAFEWLPIGRAGKAATLLGAAKIYTISQVKDALKKVYKEIGSNGGLPKFEPGKWGSPQRSDGTKGYRLDPAHQNRPQGHKESVPHINWWDKTNGTKRGKGLKEDVVPILDF